MGINQISYHTRLEKKNTFESESEWALLPSITKEFVLVSYTFIRFLFFIYCLYNNLKDIQKMRNKIVLNYDFALSVLSALKKIKIKNNNTEFSSRMLCLKLDELPVIYFYRHSTGH